MKKWLCGLLCACALVIGLTVSASAAEIVDSGYCGKYEQDMPDSYKNATWVLTDDGILTISGMGEMDNYGYSAELGPGWRFYSSLLSRVVIEDGITSIGNYAFYKCSNLENITIPDSVGLLGNYSFSTCSRLESISTGDGLTSIGTNAFASCNSLTDVSLGSSVTSIGDNAFSGCGNLEHITIQSDLASIGKQAFAGCKKLESILLPDSVTSIGLWALQQCRSIKRFIIPKGVTTIETGVFIDCSGMEEIAIPNSITSIGHGAFASCTSLTSIEIPDSVTSLGDSAFYGCSGLKSIVIPNSVTAIGKCAFYECNNLGTIILPDGLELIEEEMFRGCSHLADITLPNSVSKIEKSAFRYCSGLKSISIGNCVTDIGDYAFQGCDSLADVYYSGAQTRWKTIKIGSKNDALINALLHCNKTVSQRIPTYSTASGTSTGKPGMRTVEFDAGGDLYKNGKTRTEMKIAWNFNMFGASAIGYSKDIATAAIILSGNAYTKSLVWDTLDSLGFSHIKQENYETDNWFGNTVGYSIASATETINGQRTNVIAVVCRGTASLPEWRSNLQEMENGFAVAANDVITGLNSYIADPTNGIDTSLPVKYFITGHSRGAAVANLLGPVLSDAEGKQNVFVYTFACPTTSNDPNRQNYNNIKNFINVRDAVPALPGWLTGKVDGYNRFGLECSFDKSDLSSFDSTLSALTDGSISSDVDNVKKEHCIAVYAAYVMNANLFGSTSRYRAKVISVHCPVDVAVYDNYDRLLGTITDNVPDDSLSANGVFVAVDGDEKYLYTTSGLDLRLELSGTDTGTMTYSVEEIDTSAGETVSSRTFTGVALADGKAMSSVVAGDIAAADTQLFVETDGSISAEVGADGGETDVVMISFDTDLGEPLRDMSVPKGGKVGTLPTAKMDGYRFIGWYTDAALTSAFDADSTINSAMTLYAKYEPLYDVYGYFTNIAYDGSTLTAKLEYEYNITSAQLVVALYQDGQMIAVQLQDAASSASASTVSMSASGLYGIYQLKAFLLDVSGSCTPITESAEVSFYAN